MFKKRIKDKKFALVTLASFLLLSFCLFPCNGLKPAVAEASTHAGAVHQGHADSMGGHGCHSEGKSGGVLKSGNHNGCLHCTTSAPALLQEQKSHLPDAAAFVAHHNPNRLVLLSSSGFYPKQNLSPPGLKRSINILHSTFLI